MFLVALLLSVFCVGCAASGTIRPDGRIPVSWSLGVGDSPEGKTSLVCEFQQQRPCVIPRGTDEKPKYASFTLRVWGPRTTTFIGTLVVTYLNDSDPRHYVSQVKLT